MPDDRSSGSKWEHDAPRRRKRRKKNKKQEKKPKKKERSGGADPGGSSPGSSPSPASSPPDPAVSPVSATPVSGSGVGTTGGAGPADGASDGGVRERWILVGTAAFFGALACLFGFLYLGLRSQNADLSDRVSSLETRLQEASSRPAPTPDPSPADESARRGLRSRNESLQNRVEELEQLNDRLRTQLRTARSRTEAMRRELNRQRGGDGSGRRTGERPADGPPSRDPGVAPGADPPPGAPGPGENRPVAEFNQDAREEIDDLTNAVGLDEQEREVVQEIIVQGQREFEEEIARLQQSGQGSYHDLEQIGEEISRRVEEEIASSLPPDKAARFREYIEERRAEYERYEGSSAPRSQDGSGQ